MSEQEALDRYHAALSVGLSDYEAREEGWPSLVTKKPIYLNRSYPIRLAAHPNRMVTRHPRRV